MDVDEVGPRSQSVVGTDNATSKICHVCKVMLCDWKKEEYSTCYTSPRGQSLLGMKRAALEEGCSLCYQFWLSVQNRLRSDVSKSDSHYACFFALEARLWHRGSSATFIHLYMCFLETDHQESGDCILASAYGFPATNKSKSFPRENY
jgi:hypothetical protein